ncbi:MAG: alanine-tRNA synthetase second additional domain-containing protein [Firmicutes bacterium]|nr:alanine-tRNA synthetase second additional domain-containing protein [Bacillota bacterium]
MAQKYYEHITNPNHLYSVFFAPRGNARMLKLGREIAQQYLSPFDLLIGIIGEAGSGKSMVVKGMFPGLELSNDDEGVNVRPLPLLSVDEDEGFYAPHTYHVDMRFETAFTQIHVIADAVRTAIKKGRRVIVEHFEMLYPVLQMNAQLLIGVGEEIIVTRPNMFGPLPEDIAANVHKSITYRKMAHTAEDLVEFCMPNELFEKCSHGDVKRGFQLEFDEVPDINIKELQTAVRELIAQDIPISYHDEDHINIGTIKHPCTGPRIHVRSTGEIENFRLLKEIFYDSIKEKYIIIGLVGERWDKQTADLNRIDI